MSEKTLLILRGPPGSGKTWLAQLIAPEAMFAADDYFETEDGYDFDGEKLKEAHASCEKRVEDALMAGEPIVAVHNTFTRMWEFKHYLMLADAYHYTPFVLTCENDFGSDHGVPSWVAERMIDRMEPFLKGERKNENEASERD